MTDEMVNSVVISRIQNLSFQEGDLLVVYTSHDVMHDNDSMYAVADVIKQVTPEYVKIIMVADDVDLQKIPKEQKKEWVERLLTD